MSHHEINIRVLDGAVQPYPSPELFVGDTVRYSSPDGATRVFFPDASPYAVSEIRDTETNTLLKSGRFQFQCFVTPTGTTKEIGWDPAHPEAVGEHVVKV